MMKRKAFPTVLQQALEYHVIQSQLAHDDELQGIYHRLSNLNEKVEFLKNQQLFRRIHFLITIELRYHPHGLYHVVFHF
jgi:hypothetical protein